MNVTNLVAKIEKKEIKLNTGTEVSKFINKTLTTIVNQHLKDFNKKNPKKCVSKNRVKLLHITSFEYDQKTKTIVWKLPQNVISVYFFCNGHEKTNSEIGLAFKENLQEIADELYKIIENSLYLTFDLFERIEKEFHIKNDERISKLSAEERMVHLNPFYTIQVKNLLNHSITFKGYTEKDYLDNQDKNINLSCDIEDVFTIEIRAKAETVEIVCLIAGSLEFLEQAYTEGNLTKLKTEVMDKSIENLVDSMIEEVVNLEKKYAE